MMKTTRAARQIRQYDRIVLPGDLIGEVDTAEQAFNYVSIRVKIGFTHTSYTFLANDLVTVIR